MTSAKAATSEALWEMEDRCWPAEAPWGRECRMRSILLPLTLSDTAATSQDGSSLEFIAAIAARQCYIQDASGRGLCPPYVMPKHIVAG